MENNRFSQKVSVFHGNIPPERGILVGYAAIIEAYNLDVPIPDQMSLISYKNRHYTKNNWQVFSPRYLPDNSLYKQLVFALKYEGIHLLALKKLFEKIDVKTITRIIEEEITGQYCRKLWFLYEWLLEKKLPINDLQKGNYTPAVDDRLQYALCNGKRSMRHRIVNNLPGNVNYCPLVRKTEKLESHIQSKLINLKGDYFSSMRKDMLQRANAFLMLKDSKASFTIEGENPKSQRIQRWGKAIAQAGINELSTDELIRLQHIVIENTRMLEMGFRKTGGFIGEHDRTSGTPIPNHISAKWEDVNQLISGLLECNQQLIESDMDAVLVASTISFGFVFIHPFVDGNGRIHRFLIHHLLAKKNVSPQGLIFPVSASILDHIIEYRKVLEAYSHPVLNYIKWRETENHNVEVLNNTIDYYRYFDLTKQTEFLYDCVKDTVENIIPQEVAYLNKYDAFKNYLDSEFEMPDSLVALLVLFLEQNEGKISNRLRGKELSTLNEKEISAIEQHFSHLMGN